MQIQDGAVWINGKQLTDDISAEPIQKAGRAEAAITLGEDEYFVLGDNRISAEDGRIYGTTDLKDVQGVVMTVIRRRNI